MKVTTSGSQPINNVIFVSFSRSRRGSVSSSVSSSPSDWQQLEDEEEEEAKPIFLKFRFGKHHPMSSNISDDEDSDDDVTCYVDVSVLILLTLIIAKDPYFYC